jgi:hypothetical protein
MPAMRGPASVLLYGKAFDAGRRKDIIRQAWPRLMSPEETNIKAV